MNDILSKWSKVFREGLFIRQAANRYYEQSLFGWDECEAMAKSLVPMMSFHDNGADAADEDMSYWGESQ